MDQKVGGDNDSRGGGDNLLATDTDPKVQSKPIDEGAFQPHVSVRPPSDPHDNNCGKQVDIPDKDLNKSNRVGAQTNQALIDLNNSNTVGAQADQVLIGLNRFLFTEERILNQDIGAGTQQEGGATVLQPFPVAVTAPRMSQPGAFRQLGIDGNTGELSNHGSDDDPSNNGNNDEPPEDIESLARAIPVSDDRFEVAQEVTAKDPALGRRYIKGALLAITAVALVTTAITMPVVLLRTSDSTETQEVNVTTPVLDPIDVDEVPLIIDLPDFTKQAIKNNPSSPQAKAYQWMVDDPLLLEYNESRKLQRFALATFYYSTRGDVWGFNNGWMEYNTSECDEWYNMEELIGTDISFACHPDDDSLNTLAFFSNSLEGTIPPEIALLTRMTHLIIGGNPKLSGSIPTQIWSMPTLFVISLHRNGLSGTLPSEELLAAKDVLRYLDIPMNSGPLTGSIPSEFGAFQYLDYLGLSDNFFTGTLPSELGQLSNMYYLALDGNTFTGSIPGSIFEDMPLLERLHLRNSDFTGQVPTEVGLLSNSLWYLDIDSNFLSGSLPSELGRLSLLKVLYVYSSLFSGTIPTDIWHLSNMEKVGFESNSFSGTLPWDIGSTFGTNGSLTHLHLSNNQFKGNLPSSFDLMTNMDTLALSGNDFDGGFPEHMLRAMSSLKTLIVDNNSNLTASISKNTTLSPLLEIVDFTDTHIQGTIPDALCNSTDMTLWFDCGEFLCGCTCDCVN